MKLMTVKRYVDKNTMRIVKEGEIVEHEEARAKELIGQGVSKMFMDEEEPEEDTV